jgi:flavin reductase (DIM6/NTAB) family NADH-FMN oxidoreductase RutF
MNPVTADQYRTLLSRFATGVAVASAVDARGRPNGMTASAVSSVSLEPPMLLVCVDHTADFHAVISKAPHFALSVLADDQESLSRRFATDMDDKFEGVRYHRGPEGLPLLENAVAHILCQAAGTHEAGDHTVFFGIVFGGEVFNRPPLIHFRGGYAAVGAQPGRLEGAFGE